MNSRTVKQAFPHSNPKRFHSNTNEHLLHHLVVHPDPSKRAPQRPRADLPKPRREARAIPTAAAAAR